MNKSQGLNILFKNFIHPFNNTSVSIAGEVRGRRGQIQHNSPIVSWSVFINEPCLHPDQCSGPLRCSRSTVVSGEEAMRSAAAEAAHSSRCRTDESGVSKELALRPACESQLKR